MIKETPAEAIAEKEEMKAIKMPMDKIHDIPSPRPSFVIRSARTNLENRDPRNMAATVIGKAVVPKTGPRVSAESNERPIPNILVHFSFIFCINKQFAPQAFY